MVQSKTYVSSCPSISVLQTFNVLKSVIKWYAEAFLASINITVNNNNMNVYG